MRNHSEFEPNYIEAERFVLGMLLAGKRCAENILGKLTSDDFHHSLNAEVFDTACALFHENIPISVETVNDRMAQMHGGSAFNRKYVSWLAEQALEEVFAEYCCHLVLYYSAERDEDFVDERGSVYDENFLPFD